MSVIGIDFGDSNSYVAIARQGGIEIVTNDYSLRNTPSCVAFTPRNRILGVSAKNQQGANAKNTVSNFKAIVGRPAADPVVHEVTSRSAYKVCEAPDRTAGVEVDHCGHRTVFSADQLAGMLFGKLRESAEHYIGGVPIADCVIGVPCFWTDLQRRALLDAAKLANLNVLKLMNETTAVALNYGLYKQDLPETKDKARLVAFVDVGHSATQASICQFHKGQLKMLSVVFDPNLGGRELTDVLRRHFASEFKERFGVDATTNARAWLRLGDECEKLKKQMSANSTDIPINVECFMQDKDVHGWMKRETFENEAGNFWQRLEALLKSLLSQAKMQPSDFYACEVVGGSTRVPRVKAIVQSVFGVEPSTTLNADEAVAKGCALQGAILSPAFRVREFSLTDIQPFSIKLTWSAEKSDDGEWEAFSEGHAFPFSKVLTFYRSEPFMLEASYTHPNHIPYPSTAIGRYRISNVTPQADGESRKVKAKIRINPNGLFTLVEANTYEPKEDEPEDKPEKKGKKKAKAEKEKAEEKQDKEDEVQEPPTEQEKENGEAMDEDLQQETGDKRKIKMKQVELPVQTSQPVRSQTELNDLIEIERKLARQDIEVKELADAKNSVEEYVYDIRDKLSDQLREFIKPAEADQFRSMLEDTENWLYDEGDDVAKKVYVEKLAELRRWGSPVVERYEEAAARPDAFQALAQSIIRGRKVIDAYAAGDAAYDHLAEKDIETLTKAVSEKQSWFDVNMGKQQQRSLTEPPAVTVREINEQKRALDAVANPIINKPKPKVEPPPAPKEEANNGGDAPAPEENGAPTETQESNMEVD